MILDNMITAIRMTCGRDEQSKYTNLDEKPRTVHDVSSCAVLVPDLVMGTMNHRVPWEQGAAAFW
jgi:hypothetical protein